MQHVLDHHLRNQLISESNICGLFCKILIKLCSMTWSVERHRKSFPFCYGFSLGFHSSATGGASRQLAQCSVLAEEKTENLLQEMKSGKKKTWGGMKKMSLNSSPASRPFHSLFPLHLKHGHSLPPSLQVHIQVLRCVYSFHDKIESTSSVTYSEFCPCFKVCVSVRVYKRAT